MIKKKFQMKNINQLFMNYSSLNKLIKKLIKNCKIKIKKLN